MNIQFKKRLMSFIWRAGDVMAIAGLNFLAANLGYFNLPVEYVAFIGLVLGEVTKYLNTKENQLP